MVRPPLMAQVALEMVLRREVQGGEPLKDMVEHGPLACWSEGVLVRLGGCRFRLGHLFLLLVEKKQVR
ncbi:hypothetical protein SBA7_1010002 [Candidatus Sulfotelmatobacter sp. SbA7]|nr:hypothetical protein SBA7_1010002 [Candidatus Sulfotelmatobacter sp. SbA7]